MKSNKFIRQSGPYEVSSMSQDARGVRLIVYPAFPRYNLTQKDIDKGDISPEWEAEPRWPIQRLKNNNGGGPGIFTAIALAKAFEEFLNQGYSESQVAEWKATLKEALSDVEKRDSRAFERAMKRAEKRKAGQI